MPVVMCKDHAGRAQAEYDDEHDIADYREHNRDDAEQHTPAHANAACAPFVSTLPPTPKRTLAPVS